MRRFRLILPTAILVLGACGGGGGGGGGGGPPITGCSIAEQNQFVFDLMNDVYYWIDDVPTVINSGFNSPEEVLEAFRYVPLDRFSGIRDLEEHTALFGASQYIGYGIGLKTIAPDRVLITQAFGDGPAAAVGMSRGDEITALNGRPVSDIILSGDSIGDAFGDDEIGVLTTIDYIDGASNVLQVTLSKAVVTIETVPLASEFDLPAQKVGYLVFRNFVEPSFEALEVAFARFKAAGVGALILDLRYNGGGLISVAEYLGGLIGGTVTSGQIFTHRVHNANNRSRNETTFFTNETNALDLDKIVVITTQATASASELVINALRPFAEVTLIGETTFGKPVGAYQFEFCDKVAVPIAFSNQNAANEGDYYDGLAPDCVAIDDLDRPLGDVEENALAEALFFVENGRCSAPLTRSDLTTAAGRKIDRAQLRARDEMRQLINAY